MAFAVLALAALAASPAEATAIQKPPRRKSPAPSLPPSRPTSSASSSPGPDRKRSSWQPGCATWRPHHAARFLAALPADRRGWRAARKFFAPRLPQAEAAVPPGDYRVDIDYGFAKFSRLVTLDRERRLSLVFNLNTGAIRVLSRLAVRRRHPASPRPIAFSLFRATTGQAGRRGRPPGELLRLPAGTTASRASSAPGNAVARAEVDVKPGVLSAVDIDHHAGIVRLAVAERRRDSFRLASRRRQRPGSPPKRRGTSFAVVLAPGRYRARATSEEATFMQRIFGCCRHELEVVLGRGENFE